MTATESDDFSSLMPAIVPRKTDFSHLITTLYGPPKIGKSTFASAFPDAIFLPTEPGLNNLAVKQIPPDGSGITSWDQFRLIVRFLRSGKVPPGGTIVLDTADNLLKLATENVCKVRHVEHVSLLPNSMGYALVNNAFELAIRTLASLPFGLVMISHSKRIEVKGAGGAKIERCQPTLPETARKIVLGLSDLIMFADLERVSKDGQSRIERVIRTKGSDKYDAGDRTGTLPATIPLSFSAFEEAYKAGREKIEQGGEGAPVVREDPVEKISEAGADDAGAAASDFEA